MADKTIPLCKPSNDNAYGMAEGTIERYSRYAQEMKQIRKDEWEA